MQLRYHSPLRPDAPEPFYHPIFYRVKERLPGSPISPMSEFPPDIEWETRFVKCSYAMVRGTSFHHNRSELMKVCGSLLIFGSVLFPPHQAHHHTLLYHSHRRPLPGLLSPGPSDAYIPTRSSSLGQMASRDRYGQLVILSLYIRSSGCTFSSNRCMNTGNHSPHVAIFVCIIHIPVCVSRAPPLR